MTYRFTRAAEAEYLSAISFFEDRRKHLGAALVVEFEQAMRLVQAHPEAWKLVHPEGVRRIGLRRFPYSVFYRIDPDGCPLITAFAHHRRRPGYWVEQFN